MREQSVVGTHRAAGEGTLWLWRVELRMAGYAGIHQWEGHAVNATEASKRAQREVIEVAARYLVPPDRPIDLQVVSVVQVGV